jgi:hypothetical protein
MTYFGKCEKCHLPVTSPARPAFQVVGFEVPREQGGTNHIRNRKRTPNKVWHEGCLPREDVSDEQGQLSL